MNEYIGILDRKELREALSAVLGEEIEMNHMEILFQEFDKDNNGEIDFSEFRTIISYLTANLRKSVSASLYRIEMNQSSMTQKNVSYRSHHKILCACVGINILCLIQF